MEHYILWLQVSNTTREMFRRDCGGQLIEITHSKGIDLWFVVKKELSATSVSSNSMKPQNYNV